MGYPQLQCKPVHMGNDKPAGNQMLPAVHYLANHTVKVIVQPEVVCKQEQ
jgi:hypothetical protein